MSWRLSKCCVQDFKRTLNLLEIHQNKNLFLRCSMVENPWAKPRKSFHISHFQSNCEIFENRSRLVELNFSKHQIDLTWKNSWWWSPKFKIKQDNLFLNKNAAINFWTSISIGSNICITCITFIYASFCKIFAKQEISICTIIWLHLHLQYHAGENPCITSICITSTYICICIFLEDICKTGNFHLHHPLATFTCPCWGKLIHNKHIHLHLHPHEGHLHYKHLHLHLHPHERHLHYKKFSFAPSYGCFHVCISKKDFCIRYSMNKHLHLHLHLHPHEGHLYNKIFIRTITRLRSYLHIQ